MLSGFDARLWLTLAAAFVAAAAAVAALVRSAPSGVDERRRSRDPLPPLWRMAMPLVRLLEGTAAATMSPQRRLALEARLQQAGRARTLTPARHRAACWVGGQRWFDPTPGASVAVTASDARSLPNSLMATGSGTNMMIWRGYETLSSNGTDPISVSKPTLAAMRARCHFDMPRFRASQTR